MFLHEFSHCSQETLHSVLLANGSWHKAHALAIPDNGVGLCLPPDSPELNPIERLGPAVKAPLAWVVAAAIEALEPRVAMRLTQSSTAAIRSRTASPYCVRAVNAVCS
jgi:hypothetical protein